VSHDSSFELRLVVGSYAVLFTSLAAHAAQFAFLLWFENPREHCSSSTMKELIADIERTYGGAKKPLASRVPLTAAEQGSSEVPSKAASIAEDTYAGAEDLHTPGITEGKP
jgi:phosphatidylethanolamine N-methyltransferase